MIDLVKPVDTLSKGRGGMQNGCGEDRDKETESRLGGVTKRYGLLMWSHGPGWLAIDVALKYITHSTRSR